MPKRLQTYVILLRGINVGGKNLIPMAKLRERLEEQGFVDVATYIQSGNVIARSSLGADAVVRKVEKCLPATFKLDSSLIKVLALTHRQLQAVVEDKPKGFGDRPDTYHSDVIFLMGIRVGVAMKVFSPREGVDRVWPGEGVVYSQRLSAKRTQSRLSKIVATPAYKQMTIRNWNTATKLLAMLEAMDERA